VKPLAAAACLALAACVPWVVRPIENQGAERFDPVRYVDSIWDSKVVPEPTLMKGRGKVLRIEPDRLLVDTAPLDGRPDIAVLTGPVIRGTALRDALPFIQFSQFVNQLEFARVGNALNERAVKVAQAAQVKAGDTVRFTGAPLKTGGLLEIVPVALSILREQP